MVGLQSAPMFSELGPTSHSDANQLRLAHLLRSTWRPPACQDPIREAAPAEDKGLAPFRVFFLPFGLLSREPSAGLCSLVLAGQRSCVQQRSVSLWVLAGLLHPVRGPALQTAVQQHQRHQGLHSGRNLPTGSRTFVLSLSLVLQVSKLPKELSSARLLCFSPDSTKLFASSSQSSVVVTSLGKLECRYVHTLKPKSGECERTLYSG